MHRGGGHFLLVARQIDGSGHRASALDRRLSDNQPLVGPDPSWRVFARWLDYMRNLPALRPWRDADALTLVTASGERIQRIWAAAGVELVRIDATGNREAVLARALSALDERDVIA